MRRSGLAVQVGGERGGLAAVRRVDAVMRPGEAQRTFQSGAEEGGKGVACISGQSCTREH